MRTLIWMLASLVAILAAPASSTGGTPVPPITIFLKGGVGVVRADRVWEAGSKVCWESRGFQYCLPKDKVQSTTAVEVSETPRRGVSGGTRATR